MLYRFKQLKSVLDFNNLKIIYYGLVQSMLEYGITIWGSAVYTYLKNLEVIQKRFIKMLYSKNQRYPTDLLYAETKLFNIRKLYFKNLAIYQYKNKDKLQCIKHNYNTKCSSNEEKTIIRTNKKIGQKSPYSLGPRIFNWIPKDIRNSSNMLVFKIKLRKWLTQTDNDFLCSRLEKYL